MSNETNGKKPVQTIAVPGWAIDAANQIADAFVECTNRTLMLRFGMKADAAVPASAREASAKCIAFHYHQALEKQRAAEQTAGESPSAPEVGP